MRLSGKQLALLTLWTQTILYCFFSEPNNPVLLVLFTVLAFDGLVHNKATGAAVGSIFLCANAYLALAFLSDILRASGWGTRQTLLAVGVSVYVLTGSVGAGHLLGLLFRQKTGTEQSPGSGNRAG